MKGVVMSKSPMGRIYPKRTMEILRGGQGKVQIGYKGKPEPTRKEGERWFDKDGKEWEMKDGVARSIPKLQEARTPMFCPKCRRLMKDTNRDEKAYLQWTMCFDCVIERDTDLIKKGLFQRFEEKIETDKKYGFLKDAKIQVEEYIETIGKGIKIVNEDGKIEKWTGDETKLKEFWNKELKDINESLTKLEKKKTELDEAFQEM